MGHRRDPRQTRPLRRRRLILTAAVAAGLAMLTLGAAHAGGNAPGSGHEHDASRPGTTQRDIAEVRGAVAKYHTPARAQAVGWDLVPGLDHCFDNPGVGGMGYHYIDTDQLVDPTLDPLRPEALVFVPGPQGQLRLGAVEYIVPVDLWDEDAPPSVLGMDLHELEPVPGVHVWGLHVWLFEHNPDGMFADWNPRVTCPS
jgi:hypothetical protein